MYAAVDVVLVVGSQCRKHPEFDAASITVFGHRSDDLDGAFGALLLVVCLNNFAEGALAKKLFDLVWTSISIGANRGCECAYIAQ